MDAQLKAQLRQTIYVSTLSSMDANATPTYGSPASRSARVEEDRQVITGANGEQITTSHRVIVEAAIAPSSVLWLPGDSSADASLRREVLSVARFVDERGSDDHYELWV